MPLENHLGQSLEVQVFSLVGYVCHVLSILCLIHDQIASHVLLRGERLASLLQVLDQRQVVLHFGIVPEDSVGTLLFDCPLVDLLVLSVEELEYSEANLLVFKVFSFLVLHGSLFLSLESIESGHLVDSMVQQTKS